MLNCVSLNTPVFMGGRPGYPGGASRDREIEHLRGLILKHDKGRVKMMHGSFMQPQDAVGISPGVCQCTQVSRRKSNGGKQRKQIGHKLFLLNKQVMVNTQTYSSSLVTIYTTVLTISNSAYYPQLRMILS